MPVDEDVIAVDFSTVASIRATLEQANAAMLLGLVDSVRVNAINMAASNAVKILYLEREIAREGNAIDPEEIEALADEDPRAALRAVGIRA